YVLAILAGIAAGIINTLAGSGSAVTLPMLVFLGLDAGVANATNRVGVAVQNIAGIATYQRSGKLDIGGSFWLTLPAMLGAVVGTYIATILDNDQMEFAIGAMMVIILITIFINPNKWLREHSEVKDGRPDLGVLALFFVIGAYGGFIQAGVGVFLLAAMVLGAGYSMVHANAIKLVIVLALTLVALVVFIWSPVEINWGIGLLMAVGQSIGAWAAAKFAVSVPNANKYVRWLLIVVVIYSILKFFGILDLIF
ncbi:MAG: sulfite exporter TauE/SafE family protein, partial [Chloroflexi bacterium]|nr:sulfite exporter TauE/SafE family protein [Chloroflexota bacterium]